MGVWPCHLIISCVSSVCVCVCVCVWVPQLSLVTIVAFNKRERIQSTETPIILSEGFQRDKNSFSLFNNPVQHWLHPLHFLETLPGSFFSPPTAFSSLRSQPPCSSKLFILSTKSAFTSLHFPLRVLHISSALSSITSF